MKRSHVTQKQYAEAGRKRQAEAFRRRFIASYDTNPVAARAFVRGLVKSLTRDAGGLTAEGLLNGFIKENQLNGRLLRLALTSANQPSNPSFTLR
jgi:hypothetical protein